ncbi:hypothetical protein ABFA07_019000 [Porites harrisoni]
MVCRPVSSRLITIRLRSSPFNITIIQDPDYDDDAVEDFYDHLQEILDQSPKKDILVVLGDWNAKVGEDAFKELERHLWTLLQPRDKRERSKASGVCLRQRSCAGEYTWQTQSIQKMDMAQPKWRIP